jgi:hypothetical protein
MDDAEKAALRAKYEKPPLSFSIPLPPWLSSPQLGVWVVCLMLLVGYLFSLKMPLQRSDDFYKVIGGWSLAMGKGYCDISRPDAPFLTKYPPLGSLVMAPFMSLVGDFLRPLRLLSMFSYIASIPLIYRLLIIRTNHHRALLILVLAGLNPLTLRILNFEGNGGIMILLVVAAITILERVRDTSPNNATGIWLGILLATFFYAHRTGIVFGAGSILYLFFVLRQRRLAIITALLFGTLAFPWLLRSYVASGHWISPEYEAEIVGRSTQGAAIQTPGLMSLLQHMLSEASQFPTQVGYTLFPWSRASGGQPWPFLTAHGFVWVATFSEWMIAILVTIGWVKALRARRFTEMYLVLHSLMLLVFFFNFQYFMGFLPWFYLYLADGAQQVLGKLWQRGARIGFVAILLILLAKDTKAFWLMPLTFQDRDLRWGWVAKVVPEREAVYYLNLGNYAFSQMRYFDSGRRMAVGITVAELESLLADPKHTAHWMCLPKTSLQNTSLQRAGWQPIVVEPDSIMPRAEQLKDLELSAAQQAFLDRMEPPQALWRRPVE